jgi:transposase
MPKRFDKDFKINAVKLILEGKLKASKVAKDVGVGLSTLERWVREFKQDGLQSFPGKGYLKPEDECMRKLERENEVLRRERDILKKALSIFSSQ